MCEAVLQPNSSGGSLTVDACITTLPSNGVDSALNWDVLSLGRVIDKQTS